MITRVVARAVTGPLARAAGLPRRFWGAARLLAARLTEDGAVRLTEDGAVRRPEEG